MDQTHQYPQQQQERGFASTSDSDHWDATVQLLASMYDSAMLERNGGKFPEAEDMKAVTAASQAQFSRWYGDDAPVVARSSSRVDFNMTESLSEEDVAFIVGSTDGSIAGLSVPTVSSVNGASVHGVSFEFFAAVNAGPRNGATAAQMVPWNVNAMANESTSLTLAAMTLGAEALSAAEEARRERNRLKVRRLYYRKLERLNALRTQVTELEKSLERLKLAQNISFDFSVGTSNSTTSTTPSKPSGKYSGLLQELNSAKQRLQHENEYLRHAISQHARTARSVSATLMELHVSPTACLKIKAVTSHDCAELRDRTLEQVRNFARSRSQFRDAGTICGWQSLHLIQDSAFRFMVQKTLPDQRTDQVAQLTWSVLIDPDRFVQLYSVAVDARCYVLQTIDDDSAVVVREYRTMDAFEERLTPIRTMQLISRVRTESGCIITLTSLDHDKWVLGDTSLQQDAVVGNNLSCWIEFTDEPNSSGCACVFGGFVPIFGATAGFWAVEIVQLAVRCENLTIGAASYSLQSITCAETTEDCDSERQSQTTP